ncbi:MAG: redoxin domain-containing protein [Candidatus Methylomirabilales bacterium]
MLPSLRSWHERYGAQGLMVIGVHTPEFFWEKDPDRVRSQVKDLAIPYLVVLDSDHVIWDRYGNQYWPTTYLIDKRGNLRYRHIGEGSYADTETMIRTLLAEPA